MATFMNIAPYRARGPAAAKSRKPVAKSETAFPGYKGVKITQAVTVRRPAGELYAFWRNLGNLPAIVRPPVSLTPISNIESRWSVGALPGDPGVEGNALIVGDEPSRLIAWRSREGSPVPNAGSIRFTLAPGDEGTEVTVSFEYLPSDEKLDAWSARLSGEEIGRQVNQTLRRFKALMETGQIPLTEAQPVVPTAA